MKIKRNDEVTGYKLDFATGTLTINYKFAKALSDYGSPEYLRYKAILADFPNLKVIRKAGRTVTSTRPNKRLTYENMETHIKAYENADSLIIGEGMYDKDPLTHFLEEVRTSVDFKHWYFGHYHDDRCIGEKFTLLYDEIIPLD